MRLGPRLPTTATNNLFTLEHAGESPIGTLYVSGFKTWEYISQEACKTVDGKLTDAQLKELQGQLDDAMKAAKEDLCTEGYRLHSSTKYLCWDEGTSPATKALTDFFTTSASMLQWDHQPKKCETAPPPTGIGNDTGHAGSGG